MNAGLRFQNNTIYGHEWIPSVGFAYRFNETTSLKGNVSKGFRSPTLKELFMWGPQNANLNPESIISYETGILESFLNIRVNAELTIFEINGDNLIITIPVSGTLKYMNSGEISNKGIEFALNAEVFKNLILNTTYSYINMKGPVYATPECQLFTNAFYTLKKFQFITSIQRIGNLDNDPSMIINKVSYTLLKAKISYNLSEELKFFVSGENLLNESYQVNRYYTMPGTTFFASINYIF